MTWSASVPAGMTVGVFGYCLSRYRAISNESAKPVLVDGSYIAGKVYRGLPSAFTLVGFATISWMTAAEQG